MSFSTGIGLSIYAVSEISVRARISELFMLGKSGM